MMSTAPKITETHWLAASKKFTTGHTVMDVCNKAIEIALAEQKSIEMIRNIDIDWQEPYITAAQARELGAGNAEYSLDEDVWCVCSDRCEYGTVARYSQKQYKYRAIKAQTEPVDNDVEFLKRFKENVLTDVNRALQSEPLDPHASLRAEYIRQRDAVPCELGFYLWECNLNAGKTIPAVWCLDPPLFREGREYRYTDISCYVSKDGESAIRMLRTEAQELHRTLGNTVYWGILDPPDCYADSLTTFNSGCIYTYRTKATIRLDGKMVTPEQAAAEWKAKRETHDVWFTTHTGAWVKVGGDFDSSRGRYELRPKQPTWTGSREDVIALLKDEGLL
jgi:hypothetical protein